MTRITYTIQTPDLLNMGYTVADVAMYAEKLETALDELYPHADVTVTVENNASGATAAHVESDGGGEWADFAIDKKVTEIANRILEGI